MLAFEGLLLLLAAVCVVGQAAVVNWLGLCRVLAGCFAATRRCLGRLCSAGLEETTADAAGEQSTDQDELLRKVTVWQLWFFKNNLIACQGCLGLLSMQVVGNAWRGYERLQDWIGLRDLIIMISYLFIILLQKYISRFGKEAERLRTLQACAVYYSFHIASMAAFVWICDEYWLVSADVGLMTVRICVVVCVLQKPWIVLGCFVYSSVYLVRAYSVDETLLADSVVRQLANTGILLVGSELCRRFIIKQSKVTQEAETMRHAAERLLDLLCDAVAQVDQQLCFVSHSARLAGMLIPGSHRRLAGSRLEDFLDEGSAESLRRVLQSASRYTEPAAGAINLRMRDSFGSMLKLEAFYIHFRDFGKHSYLIGFRECAENPGNSVAPLANRATSRPRPLSIEQCARVCDTSSPDGVEEVSSDATSSSHGTTIGVKSIFPSRRPTVARLVQDCLVDLSKSYNYDRPVMDPCCLYHGALEALQGELETLQARACQPTFMLHTQWQCHACGIMQPRPPTEETCNFCQAAHQPEHGTLPAWARGLNKEPKPSVSAANSPVVEL
eukprot:TRINITY_DN19390_c0_g1_i2.p1 TRINITY_DN19390_c0_g1~~TRINITY_DN19390_c0_g1_i2.p1  ORF type:complete len:556 (+),score=86.24 TRINITY_DN19390_c0_g1_i2:140-1807(+)